MNRGAEIGLRAILCTSTDRSDDILAEQARKWGFEVFRGDLQDVAKRAHDCCELHGLHRFVRVCGDSPFFDVSLARELLALARRGDLDMAYDSHPIRGSSIEVISAHAIEVAAREGSETEREHIGLHIRLNPGRFRLGALIGSHEDVSLTVDTDRDLKKADWIARKKPTGFGEIARLAKQWESRQSGW